MGKKLKLTWQNLSSHRQELFRNLIETQQFTDVTLISDDQHEYRVHKFILSASSSVFQKLLSSNPLNSSIYLRGIHHEELESILQYFYLGEVTFYHERMNEFLNVAKDLDIKELSKHVIDGDEHSERVHVDKSFVEENPVESDENQGNDASFSQIQECDYQSTLAANLQQHIKLEGNLQKHNKSIQKGIKYPEFENQSMLTGNLQQQIKSKHEGKKYPCTQCNAKATSKSNLQEHISSIHEGIKFPCQQCDYKGTKLSSLKRHIWSIHEGIKFPCQQCDYKASQVYNLEQHIKIIHEGIKYPCQKCDYQASKPQNLQQHIKSRHERLKYPCKQCDYQGSPVGLRAHVKIKH